MMATLAQAPSQMSFPTTGTPSSSTSCRFARRWRITRDPHFMLKDLLRSLEPFVPEGRAAWCIGLPSVIQNALVQPTWACEG